MILTPVLRNVRAAAAAALLILGAVAARADTSAEAMRGVVTRNKDASVTLFLVVKIGGGPMGGDENTELEASGTVIDDSGLIVAANSAIDPIALASAFSGGDSDFVANLTSRVVSVRILTGDGRELVGKVVLRDADQNLAFIRPVAAPSPALPFVNMKSAAAANLGDPVFLLGRLGKAGNRSPKVASLRVSSVVERPRTRFVLETLGLASVGNLAFAEGGQPIGMVTMKLSAGARSGLPFSPSEAMLPIIVPANDILEIAAQAPQAKDVKDTAPPPAPAPKTAPKAPAKPAPKAPKKSSR